MSAKKHSAAMHVYTVQTWDGDGALVNSYEVAIETAAELRELRKFLLSKFSHVVIAPRGAK